MKKGLYGLVGVILSISVILTSSHGLADENIEIYQMAMDLEKELGNMGFEGFDIREYPVSFYTGNADYVVTYQNGDYEICKREPVIDSFAGTIYEVDGEYQVIVPEFRKMDELLNVMNSASDLAALTEKEEASVDVSGKEYLATTIWHEAFHAYQYTRYEEGLDKLCTSDQEDFDGEEEVRVCDKNQEARDLFEKRVAALKKAISEQDVDMKKALILQYRQLTEERNALLTENAIQTEKYYTVAEGTAYYVESNVFRKLYGEQAYQDVYRNGTNTYQDGTGKYYELGMLECMLLDQINPEWKNVYAFDISLDELLYQN